MMWMSLLLASSFDHALSLDELGERADSVVLGEVTSLHSQTRGGLPWTVAEVAVSHTLAGAPAQTIELAWPGGMMAGGVEYTVAGTPELHTGDTVLAFVRAGQPVALAQGVWLVQDELHIWSPTGLHFDSGELPSFVSLEQVRLALEEEEAP